MSMLIKNQYLYINATHKAGDLILSCTREFMFLGHKFEDNAIGFDDSMIISTCINEEICIVYLIAVNSADGIKINSFFLYVCMKSIRIFLLFPFLVFCFAYCSSKNIE